MNEGPLKGVRVVEVAQFVFVPSGGAVLADWGAEVIKVEHAERGDPQRGFANKSNVVTNVNAGLEHANRGKRSIGLALDHPDARTVLYELIAEADVFLTNYLPKARRRLSIDVEDIRKVNPDIIYARGSNVGPAGNEANRGGFDLGTFWARGAGAAGVSPKKLDKMLTMPSPAYGDTIAGTTLAGGIAAALFQRERTGKTSVVDVSLLGTAAWATGMAVDLSLATNVGWEPPTLEHLASTSNPLVGAYPTSDGRYIQLVMNRPGLYWQDFCTHIDRADLPADERFSTVELLMTNASEAEAIIAKEIGAKPFKFWLKRFETLKGQWSIVQDTLQLGNDEQLRANGHVTSVTGADGSEYELVTSPVQFDTTPIQLDRAPTFAEHTDELLRSLGHTEESLIDLKVSGAVT
ncbi:CaiB/BaiF CoA transferase family protein [Rhodococcus wratislaviensis]|uniref:CaiB/BaiF CoA transferase family protein n=1 Tax=Rhodococcus wratislaviensis TaxID=44752 RepID=UPI0036554846